MIKVCANPDTYRRMADDMDVDAGRMLFGKASLDDVGAEISGLVVATASGAPTRSEALGHRSSSSVTSCSGRSSLPAWPEVGAHNHTVLSAVVRNGHAALAAVQ